MCCQNKNYVCIQTIPSFEPSTFSLVSLHIKLLIPAMPAVPGLGDLLAKGIVNIFNWLD